MEIIQFRGQVSCVLHKKKLWYQFISEVSLFLNRHFNNFSQTTIVNYQAEIQTSFESLQGC